MEVVENKGANLRRDQPRGHRGGGIDGTETNYARNVGLIEAMWTARWTYQNWQEVIYHKVKSLSREIRRILSLVESVG